MVSSGVIGSSAWVPTRAGGFTQRSLPAFAERLSVCPRVGPRQAAVFGLSAQIDAAATIENFLFTVTTAFALSRVLTIAAAKLADYLNPGVKLEDAEWDLLRKTGKASAPQVLRTVLYPIRAALLESAVDFTRY